MADQKRTALITGASSGIGYELSRIFAREGYNLVLVARSEQKLAATKERVESAHGISATVIPKDLALPTAPVEIYRQLQDAGAHVDVLVNNAGFTVYGSFLETNPEDELQLMQVNMVTLTHLTKLFLPSMVERGWGRILNLASTAAFQPGPRMAIYYASKAYVLFFSEGLAVELEGTGVTVTALCPGPTETGFQKRGNMEGVRLVAGRQMMMMSARSVARAGYRGLMKGQTVVVPGVLNWLGAQGVRLAPRKLTARLIHKLHERV